MLDDLGQVLLVSPVLLKELRTDLFILVESNSHQTLRNAVLCSTVCAGMVWLYTCSAVDIILIKNTLCPAEFSGCCATADTQSAPAALTAYAARRWLARNAAGVKAVRSYVYIPETCVSIPAYLSLISCLPALEDVILTLPELVPHELHCLLEALAWWPRLRVLALYVHKIGPGNYNAEGEAPQPCPCVFAKLRSLRKLRLSAREVQSHTMAGVVEALVSLTGLAELELNLQSSVVPAALGQLKGLRSLVLSDLRDGVFMAGCLELPKLERLMLLRCFSADAEVLPGVSALQSLTSIEFEYGQAPRFFDQHLVQLRRLQRIIYHACWVSGGYACLWLSRLPADMGTLRSSLLHLRCRDIQLPQFPLALTQLVALEHLDASWNEFAMAPAGITALSRLTELVLGRRFEGNDMLQQHEQRPLDVRALGDLSAFPALCRLELTFCKVMLCESMLGAVRHTSLASIAFIGTHPAPESAPVFLQLSQALRQVGRGSVLSFDDCLSGSDSDSE